LNLAELELWSETNSTIIEYLALIKELREVD